MCELFCVAGYSGCQHNPQSLVCLASSLSVDGGRWPGRYMATEHVLVHVYMYINRCTCVLIT